MHFIDVQTDVHPNALESFDAQRVKNVRELKEKHNINLGLHTLSGVNVAEISPFCRDAVDQYLKAYIDLAPQVGAEWIVVHGAIISPIAELFGCRLLLKGSSVLPAMLKKMASCYCWKI